MVKSYLRVDYNSRWGIICSADSNCLLIDKYAIVAALNEVVVWHTKEERIVARLNVSKSLVNKLAISDDHKSLAVGYEDGSIKVIKFNMASLTAHAKLPVNSDENGVFGRNFSLLGHRRAITALRFNHEGTMLFSGSRDTMGVIWDVVGEAGLFQTSGHKDAITDAVWLSRISCLITCSKDTYLKVWHIPSRACVQTVDSSRHEVWAMDVNANQTNIITGSRNGEMRVYDIGSEDEVKNAFATDGTCHVIKDGGVIRLKKSHHGDNDDVDAIMDRIVSVRYSAQYDMVVAQFGHKGFYVVKVRSEEECAEKLNKKIKKMRAKSGGDGDGAAVAVTLDSKDLYVPTYVMKTPSKCASIAFDSGDELLADSTGHKATRLCCCYANNTIQMMTVKSKMSQKSSKKKRESIADEETSSSDIKMTVDTSSTLSIHGHRGDIRSVAISRDETMVATCGSGEVKVWNRSSNTHLRSMTVAIDDEHQDDVTCVLFSPDDRFVIVGTKSGSMCVFSIESGDRVTTEQAHEGVLSSIVAYSESDKVGVVSCGSDKCARIWSFVDKDSEILSFKLERVLQTSEEAVDVAVSTKWIALACMDNTVRVYYLDSFKFAYSLFGHSLPINSLDISSDESLVITGSADKTIKLWGLDFGDCHKSLRGHSKGIMRVKFQPATHYFYSVGKDGDVKYWDADVAEEIQSFDGAHYGDAYALDVSRSGELIVTAGKDRRINLYSRTDDQVFIEEEHDKKLEGMIEQGVTVDIQKQGVDVPATASGAMIDIAAARLSANNMMEVARQGELIMDALELAVNNDASNPLFCGSEPSDYVLKKFEGLELSAIERTLLLLPAPEMRSLLSFTVEWIEKEKKMELSLRILYSIIHILAFSLTVADDAMTVMLERARDVAQNKLNSVHNAMGMNQAALSMIQQELESKNNVKFYSDLAEKVMLQRQGVSVKQQEKRKSKKKSKHSRDTDNVVVN